MGQNLYEQAKQNIKYRRLSWISVFIGVIVFMVFFSYWLSIDMALIWPWFVIIPALITTFGLAYFFGTKVTGKKDAVLKEMERIRDNQYTVEEIVDELELKQLNPNYKDNDFV